LRTKADQTLLVILNLGKSPIQDYRFCLQEGPLQSGSAGEIFKNIQAAAPQLNTSGGFNNYQPIEVLEPYTTYIIVLD
jgi:hypothetical protein